jgi:hypothetical protein
MKKKSVSLPQLKQVERHNATGFDNAVVAFAALPVPHENAKRKRLSIVGIHQLFLAQPATPRVLQKHIA